jgi:hypothetical protein
METTNKLDLSQFTGTENYYMTNRIFAPDMLHTDGVQYFAETAHAYWFLDIVALDIAKYLKKEPFLSIVLQVKNGSATIFIEDGDCNLLETRSIEYTDCPDGEYSFFLTNNVLMLTSEY